MDIAVILNAHSQPNLVLDTLESITTYVSEKILVVVDGAAWDEFDKFPLPASKLKGFYHNKPKSPYRNVALGLKTLRETYPESTWYCYCESDVLFGSDRFKHNLQKAEEMGIWMLGSDGRVDNVAMPLVQSLIGEFLKSAYYLLGCCQFFHKDFLKKLEDLNFFEKFLHLTNNFTDGFFPFYSGYDLSEHMYPTLCRHFGGNIGVFATNDNGVWHGASDHFPCRWKPEITMDDGFLEASIIHPVKDPQSPVRQYYRERRNQWKHSQMKEKLSESFLISP